jgi:hypothetical protein
MPNPVAANDLQPISGSLQTSRVSYGVETADKNYGQNYNGTTWYSDIPNNGQFYTIISDNYTANYYVSRSNAEGAYVEGGLPAVDEYSAPVFWVTVGTSSLDVITIVNGLPDRIGQVPFNSGSQALNWIASSSNYFAVGPDYYAQIDADNLALYLDANQIISYPTTMSTWYDISGYSNNATLTNSPTWNSNGWFDFDGTDDYALQNPILPAGASQYTIEAWWRAESTKTQVIWEQNASTVITGTRGCMILLSGGTGGFNGQSNDFHSAVSYVTNKWYHWIITVDTGSANPIKVYSQGTLAAQGDTSGGATNLNLGAYKAAVGYKVSAPSEYFDGQIEKVRVYPKALTAAEVAQNYYGGPIVTDGLVYALDAGNLVSYPKSGTAWYALTGSAGTATLTNGPVFNPADGGLINFDGVDDYAVTSNFPSLSNWSTEIWLNPNVYTTAQKVILDVNLGIRFEIINGYFNSHFGNGSGWIYTNLPSTTPIAANTWFHVVVTVDASVNYQAKVYVNGILENTTSTSSGTTPNIPLYIARFTGATGYEFNGKISAIRIYNKALTAAEVLQNYNATN